MVGAGRIATHAHGADPCALAVVQGQSATVHAADTIAYHRIVLRTVIFRVAAKATRLSTGGAVLQAKVRPARLRHTERRSTVPEPAG